jgi:hypothetical protein
MGVASLSAQFVNLKTVAVKHTCHSVPLEVPRPQLPKLRTRVVGL